MNIPNGLIVNFASMYIIGKLYDKKVNFKNFSLYIIILLVSIIMALNYVYVNGFIRITLITSVNIIFNYFVFRNKTNFTIISSIVFELLFIISEFVVSIMTLAILMIDREVAIEKYMGTFQINVLIVALCFIMINMKWPKKLYFKLIKITDKIPKKVLLAVFALIMIIVNFFLISPYYEIKTEYILIVNMVLIFIYSFILFKVLEQKNKYIKINNKYNMTNTTLKELEQNVTRLKITNHENKNQLLTIRNMIKKGEDSDALIKHIEKIVDTKIKDDEQLMFQTSTITNSMISSIIYSKMLTMKENNINASLSVDRDIKDLYLSDMSEDLSVEVCKIIGVYLDNAIEEVSKLKDKIINIEVYAEGKTLCIAISNNYEGEIDLSELDNPGYTTKENGHGYGLSLVAEIVNDNHKLTTDREIKDNIFKQILKIKM